MMCGLVRPVFRLPYVPLSREQREAGAVLLRAVQEHIPGCKVRRAAPRVCVRVWACVQCLLPPLGAAWRSLCVGRSPRSAAPRQLAHHVHPSVARRRCCFPRPQEVRVMEDSEFQLIDHL